MTFKETNAINADLAEGSNRTQKRSPATWPPTSPRRRPHAAALHILNKAQGKSHGLQDVTIVSKIGDLTEWQQGLFGF